MQSSEDIRESSDERLTNGIAQEIGYSNPECECGLSCELG